MKVAEDMLRTAVCRTCWGFTNEFDELNVMRIIEGDLLWVDGRWWRRIDAETDALLAAELAEKAQKSRGWKTRPRLV